MHRRHVVITGLGVLAPNGCGKDTFWQACLQGRSGVRPITRFITNDLPTRIAGEITDFSPTAFGLTPVECTLLDRGTQFAIAAANLALDDAGFNSAHLQDSERERTGVYMGTAMASVEEGERLWVQLTGGGTHPPRTPTEGIEPSAFVLSYMPSAVIAAHHSLRGPCLTLATGCSAGADAIGQAFWQIQEGHADRMLAGGTDSALSRVGLNVFNVMHALSTYNEEPARASRPYEARRDGFVLSEGAAVLLLEERELALARSAHIYAEIQTFVTNTNAHHMAILPKDGAPLQALLQQALQESHLAPEQLGYINSHGSSTPPNDLTETIAYKKFFGSHAYHIPISSTKSLIGHTQGAASAIEVLVTALALDQQILPPTINLEVPDPSCDLDYVPHIARPINPHQPLRFALSHSSGFGGINTALVLAKHEDTPRRDVDRRCSLCASRHRFARSLQSPSASDNPNGDGNQIPSLKPQRRVVITGLGTVTPNGMGKAAFWGAICAGHSAIGPPTRYNEVETRLCGDPRDSALRLSGDKSPAVGRVPTASPSVGEIKHFRAEDYIDRKLAQRTDRMTHFVFAAVQEALQDAGLVLEEEDPSRIGAVVANTLAGVEYVTQQIERLYLRGPRFMSAHTALAWLHVANVGRLSVHYGLQGYCKVLLNDTCGGLDALGMAYQAIRRGNADVLIAGGTEAPLHPCILHLLDVSPPFQGRSHPSCYRPFDLRADGLLIAEGAGICILEEYEHALQRGAPIYGEIVGYAQTCAPGDLTPHALPDVAAYVRAIRLALTQADLEPENIACIFPDGRAIPAWDAIETAALREVFGPVFDTLPCSVPRTQFGHTLAAAGALDTICALMTLQEQQIPPTINCESPDPAHCPPCLVRESTREQPLHSQAALICARGLGGSHVVLALKGKI
jgi:3-oxoacyl-(acyl-carrier-protein) synthase